MGSDIGSVASGISIDINVLAHCGRADEGRNECGSDDSREHIKISSVVHVSRVGLFCC